MIAGHRARHRRTFVVLTPLLVVASAAGLMARRPMPTMAASTPPFAADGWEDAARMDGADVRYRVRRNDAGLWLELAPIVDLERPDVLVYWSPTNVAALDDSRLLGSLAGTQARRFELPAGATGTIALFSLAHQELFASANLPQVE